MKKILAPALIALAAVPAVALAAAAPGSYKGVSSGKYVQIGAAEEPTDKGKVTFSVKSNKVLSFKVRGQYFQCPAAEVPVTIKTIKLNSRGKGVGTYKDPNVGTLRVTITVTSAGKASGSIVRPKSAPGLCNPDYPVKFTARKR